MLSKEQFNNLRKQGLTTDQIVKFEKGETPRKKLTRMQAGWKGVKTGWLGVGKGLLSSAVTIPGLFEKAITFGKTEKTSGEKIFPESWRTVSKDAPITEKIGFGTEQVAEFFAPIPGTRVVKGGVLSSKLLAGTSKLPKLARLGAKAGMEGAEFATRTAVQRGEVKPGDIGIGAGAVIAGGVVTKLGAKVFDFMPKWLMEKAIGQKSAALLEGKNVSKFMLEKKRFGTVDSLIKKSENEIQKSIASIARKVKIPTKELATIASDARKSFDGIIKEMKEEKAEGTLESISKILTKEYKAGLKAKRNETGLTSIQETNAAKEMLNIYKETVLREALKAKSAAGKGLEIFDIKNLLSMGIGGIGGGPLGIALGFAGKKASESTMILSTMGVTAEMLRKAGPILQKLTPAERGVLSQIIQQMTK